MPPRTRSRVTPPPPKKVETVLKANSRPLFVRTLPLELREMIYKYLLVPRTLEVKFMSNQQARAHAQAILNSNVSKKVADCSPSKYVYFDEDLTDTNICQEKKPTALLQKFKFVNTSKNKLVLHAINQETRRFALKHYTHIFKINSTSTGLLFNFNVDYLAFTTQLHRSANEKKYQFIGRKGFQRDIYRIQNMAYLFFCHYKELDKVHKGTPNARSFVTKFPALKKVIVTLPLEHMGQCPFCNGNQSGEAVKSSDQSQFDHANSHFEELKQKLKDAGTHWVAPELIYKTHCWRQNWNLALDEPKTKKFS